MIKLFQKKVEDFVCENCGVSVIGNGYTNHCPYCLWSKHVDNNPGDREALCGGKMYPKSIEKKADQYVINHVCESCGHEKKNKTSSDDDFNKIIEVSKNSL